MGRRLWCVIGTLVGSVALVFAMSGPVESGDVAPSFTLKLLDGGTITLDDLRGKLAVLRFTASW